MVEIMGRGGIKRTGHSIALVISKCRFLHFYLKSFFLFLELWTDIKYRQANAVNQVRTGLHHEKHAYIFLIPLNPTFI